MTHKHVTRHFHLVTLLDLTDADTYLVKNTYLYGLKEISKECAMGWYDKTKSVMNFFYSTLKCGTSLISTLYDTFSPSEKPFGKIWVRSYY